MRANVDVPAIGVRPCLLLLLVLMLAPQIEAQEPAARRVQPTSLQTKGGSIRIDDASSAAAWTAIRTAGEQGMHVLARFASRPGVAARDSLRRAGVEVLTPYFGTTYWVRVSGARDSVALVRSLLLSPVAAQFKAEPALWEGRFERFVVTPRDSAPRNYVLNPDGSLNLTVVFHDDVSREVAAAVLRRHARQSTPQSDQRWIAVTTREGLRALAAEDAVRWVDAGPAPELPDNDQTRAFIGVDPVQNFNTGTGAVQGLGGRGVRIGIFDSGMDETHDDLGVRVVQNDAGLGSHGTHVAGIAAGSGQLSNGTDNLGNANGGTAFQWRGMAPLAELIDVPSNRARFTDQWLNYIGTRSLDVSNHSYSLSFDGAYNAQNALRDQVIRGAATWNGTPIPARLQVYSAGNHGNSPFNGGEQIGYFALTKQIKNAVIVGNFDRANNRISQTSSLGPTQDGRIKPDVVAPGTNVKSTNYAPATASSVERRDFYGFNSGTSMAAPVVTGVLALMLQQYATTYGVDIDIAPPWPSTLRAALVQSAADVVSTANWFTNEDAGVRAFTGPDFTTGYGMVNAQGATNVVATRRLVQDSVIAECDTVRYRLNVPSSRVPLRVTLAWDDVEGNDALPVATPQLVNDLDLVLVDPLGNPHYPWLLDQQALDPAGNPVPDASQTCGSALAIQRAVQPTLTPNFVSGGNPNNVNDPIGAGALQAAGRGKDHLNNLEQVFVAFPRTGGWQVLVIGFGVAQPPQRFSLAGFDPTQFVVVDNNRLCRMFPELCGELKLFDICRRYPQICEPRYIEPRFGRIPIRFVNPDDRIVLPVSALRANALSGSAPRTAAATPRGLQLTSDAAPLRVEVYSIGARRKVREGAVVNGRTRLDLSSLDGDDHVLVITPGRGARMGRAYELVMSDGSKSR